MPTVERLQARSGSRLTAADGRGARAYISLGMDIPRFEQHLRSGQAPGNPGDAFQVFAHELLSEDYPGLHFFPGGGKDGGIDLAQSAGGRRAVVECKYVGADGLQEARRRWLEVAGHLSQHLSAPGGPTAGQAQYAPWYRTDPPIREYVFCVSSELGNLRQADELKEEIERFFEGLSAAPHLAHLSGLSVRVLDWNDLRAALLRRPHLLFRWFKLTRHYGLVTLDEVPDYTTFRSYLFGDRLPYYSRREHLGLAPAPDAVGVLDERGLLGLVEGGQLTGLVLTGGGGVGKTRLTLEIGWLAQAEGWLVLRVLRKLKEAALEHLARWITPETKVLLLIDYVETQRDFAELVDVLNDLNDAAGLRLRYAANCRASYYPTIATTERHREVSLSPASGDPAAAEWFEGYQNRTVRHILEHSGIEVTERHLAVCNDVPVLAVFMSYLRGAGRQTDLESLLEEQDFSRWLVKRLQLSFGGPVVSATLAQLVALFPLPPSAARSEGLREHEALFNRLATDRWIELLPSDETREADTWVTAHDVLADQILLSYFKDNPYTVENFVRGLLSLARRVGCLRQALITLQRLVDKPALKALDWPGILDSSIAEDPPAWRDANDVLVRTSLLTPLQIIDLLGRHEEVWEGAEEEAGFQLAVGWLARWALRQEGLELGGSRRASLESWLRKAAAYAVAGNYVLTSGVKFCPGHVREAALDWIRARPRDFQTHYLMVAWLEQGLPPEEIAPAVEQWSTKFSANSHLSFIARAWLDAKADKELLRAPITSWLAVHRGRADARFVYRAWLSAGGDPEFVKPHLPTWLANHGDDADARFIYQSWLDAGGGTEILSDSLAGWLTRHKTLSGASFVYRSWLDAGGDAGAIHGPLMEWLGAYSTDAGAGFVYPAWLNAGGDAQLISKYVAAWLAEHGALAHASFVYTSWLDAGGGTETVREYLLAWLAVHRTDPGANFVYTSWLYAGGGTEAVGKYVLAWLAAHGASAEANFVYTSWLAAGGGTTRVSDGLAAWLAEHGARGEASFVYESWLKAGGEKRLIEPHLLAWLAEHGADARAEFIYTAWLDSKGSFSTIRSHALGWLDRHREEERASFLMKHLSKQADVPAETVRVILDWCLKFSENEDVLWRLTQLGRHLLRKEVAEEVCAASETVLGRRLSAADGLTPIHNGQGATLLAYLIEAPEMQAGDLRRRVDDLLLRLLRHPASFGDDPKPHRNVQRRSYALRVADLVASGALSVTEDREALRRFLRWVDNWEPTWKVSIRPLMADLERSRPAPGVWDLLRFK